MTLVVTERTRTWPGRDRETKVEGLAMTEKPRWKAWSLPSTQLRRRAYMNQGHDSGRDREFQAMTLVVAEKPRPMAWSLPSTQL